MRLVDTFPTNKIKGLEYCIGQVFPFGATVLDNGAKKPFVEIPFPEEFRIGDVYTMMVFGFNIETTEYGYRFDGEYAPEKWMVEDFLTTGAIQLWAFLLLKPDTLPLRPLEWRLMSLKTW